MAVPEDGLYGPQHVEGILRNKKLFFSHGAIALVVLGLLSEVYRIHSDTPHLARLLWTSERPIADASTGQHETLSRDKTRMSRLDSNAQSQQARGLGPMP
jgi:hypothetical protein